MIYDVIIIGAGPAGSTAAKYLAEHKRRILLIEKESFPRDKPCAGGLCRHIKEFSYLDELFHLNNNYIKSVCSGSETIYPPGIKAYTYHSDELLFFNVKRVEFDKYLADLAKKSGAELKEKTKAIKVLPSENHISIKLSSKETVKSRTIIAADGPNGLIGKQIRTMLGYERKWKKNLSLSVVESLTVNPKFIEKTYGEDKKAILYFKWKNLTGYAWVFPKYKTINIGYAGLYSEMEKIDIKTTFNELLDFLRKKSYIPNDLNSIKLRGGFIPWNGPLKKFYYDRMILAGDAAGFVSPISGEGIYYAMDSGRIAAQTLNKALQKDNVDTKQFKRYHQECMKRWGKQLHYLKLFRNLLLKYPGLFLNAAQHDLSLQKQYADIFNGDANILKAAITIPGKLITSNLKKKYINLIK